MNPTPESMAWMQAAVLIQQWQDWARFALMVRTAQKLPPLSDERRAQVMGEMWQRAERKP